jgi:hypothetical protein
MLVKINKWHFFYRCYRGSLPSKHSNTPCVVNFRYHPLLSLHICNSTQTNYMVSTDQGQCAGPHTELCVDVFMLRVTWFMCIFVVSVGRLPCVSFGLFSGPNYFWAWRIDHIGCSLNRKMFILCNASHQNHIPTSFLLLQFTIHLTYLDSRQASSRNYLLLFHVYIFFCVVSMYWNVLTVYLLLYMQ